MSQRLGRRSFIKKSLAASVAAPMVMSLEEHALVNKAEAFSITAVAQPGLWQGGKMPMGKIGKVEISRIICGGNLISGYAHSRDLIYLSGLLKQYFTDEKIMGTWALCEAQGINTMVCYPEDKHALEVYLKYRARGGRIQYLAQVAPPKDDLKTCVKQAADNGASGVFLVGNLGDEWTRSGGVGRIGELLGIIKEHGLICGVGGHELHTPMACEKAGIHPDFYMKTLHSMNYWSKRQPGQIKEVIDNYGIDNYWCLDPEATIEFMQNVKAAWLAYKVLAAGAIPPKEGFRHAFENGADFAVVGMFDFQVAEDAKVANELFASPLARKRAWRA
jgi:hypothetical protein